MDSLSPRSPHIKAAHERWQTHIQPGDLAIDATCGNGKDTYLLAQLTGGNLYAIDIQEEAIATTEHHLKAHLERDIFDNIRFVHTSHAQFPTEIAPNTVTAIIYNLGYLPGGDKSITTLSETTLQSLHHALPLLKPGGFISITFYPGHDEGAIEQQDILNFVNTLPPDTFTCDHQQWLERPKAPSLLIINKKTDAS